MEKGFFKNHFYKLVEIGNAITLEIDGVRMHQTKNKTPLQDASDKVRTLGVTKNSVVLDVCTGLGYSALASVKAGARKVYTIEKDESVLKIAKQNPASSELFSDSRIEIINKDANEAVLDFQDGFFDFILHDPPRLSFAGELYSLEFYRQLHRILKKGGKLFHYTGTPGAARGKNIPKGVKQRLSEAGFERIIWIEDCLGFIASKNSVHFKTFPVFKNHK